MVRALVQSHTTEPELKRGSNFLHIFSQERAFRGQVLFMSLTLLLMQIYLNIKLKISVEPIFALLCIDSM